MKPLKNIKREDSQLYQSILWNSALNEDAMGNLHKAQLYFERYFELRKSQVQRFFTFLSEKEREMFIESLREKLNEFYAVNYKHKKQDATFAGLVFNYELLSKSLLLNSSRQLQNSISSNGNESLVRDWSELKSLKNRLIKLETQELEEQSPKSQLEEKINTLEKSILSKSKQYNETQRDFTLKWQDIQKELSKDEVAIEFINFSVEYLIPQSYKDTIYSAIILCADKKPQVIHLCSGKELRLATQQAEYNFSDIHSLIWKPLEKHLKDKQSIYVSPSGLLHTIPFACVQKDNSDIRNVLSTKDILRIKDKRSDQVTPPKAVLFGGADYGFANDDLSDSKPHMNTANFDISTFTQNTITDSGLTRGQGFRYLPGTKAEVQTIGSILTNVGWDVDLYIDKYATETSFKSYSSSSPKVLHISTHGFYFPKPNRYIPSNSGTDNPYKLSDNPLMRSGLAFAGANNVWDKERSEKSTDDGILTAYEVANTDLSNTQLVVLSACKTGLGDIVGNEGIYGLQRAFRLAGVKSMIVSLWEVSDDITTEFMEEFYSSLSSPDNDKVKEAFSKAQNILKNRYPEYPEKWGGFILIE